MCLFLGGEVGGLRTNSDYFPIQHSLNGLCNRDGACLLRGTVWIFIHIAGEIWSFDRAVLQEGSCWSLTAEARVRPVVSPHAI